MLDNKNRCPQGVTRIVYSTRPDGLPIEFESFKSRQWPGMRLQYRRMTGPLSYEFVFSGRAHRFFLLDIARLDGETLISGLPRITNRDLRDKFVFAGQDCSITGWSKIEKPAAVTLVELDPKDDNSLSSLPPLFMQSDLLLRSIMTQFKSLAVDQVEELPGYAEALSIMLLQQFRRTCAERVREDGEGGLTPRQLRQAISYIEDSLDRDISIADMARNIGISSFHFIRMFKKSTGLPPHKFYVARRVDRAKDLLQQHHLSIAEVAEMSGFNGASQLARAFRKIVGTNPSVFRRQQR